MSEPFDPDDIMRQMKRMQEERAAKEKHVEPEGEPTAEKPEKPAPQASRKKIPPKVQKKEAAVSEVDIEQKFNDLIAKSEILKNIIQQQVTDATNKRLDEFRTKAVEGNVKILDAIQGVIDKHKEKMKPLDFENIEANDILNWIADKIKKNPAGVPEYIDLVNRFFSEKAYEATFAGFEEAQNAVKYQYRSKSKKKPGADLPKLKDNLKLFKLFFKEQYGDVMQSNIFDYEFYLDLFSTFLDLLTTEMN